MFDRFYRAQDARGLPGSGLGLAIVRQAAESCGGFAEARNAPGGGALLRVSFGDRCRSHPRPRRTERLTLPAVSAGQEWVTVNRRLLTG